MRYVNAVWKNISCAAKYICCFVAKINMTSLLACLCRYFKLGRAEFFDRWHIFFTTYNIFFIGHHHNLWIQGKI